MMSEHKRPSALDAFFQPQSVALVGASEKEGSVGRTLALTLIQAKNEGIEIYFVNPKRKAICDHPCFLEIEQIDSPIELLIVATPAATVPNVIRSAAKKGVKAAVIISAGFAEMGEPGHRLEQEILEIAREHQMRIIGPNCLGVMTPHKTFNGTFAANMAKPGNIALLSQSGAICTAVLDWCGTKSLGLSALVSIGSMIDVEWGDLISYYGEDPETKTIVIYMESLKSPANFFYAAQKYARKKPIILIKSGRTSQGATAVMSHTGGMAAAYDLIEALMERTGIMIAQNTSQLFDLMEFTSMQNLPKGDCLTILTNAGGPAVLATDMTELTGANLTQLASCVKENLKSQLPEAASTSNPIDLLGDAQNDRYKAAIDAIGEDTESSCILAILTQQDMTDSVGSAKMLVDANKHIYKPILASFMGGEKVAEGRKILAKGKVPCYEYSDQAAWVFARIHRWQESLKALHEYSVPADQLLNRLSKKDRKAQAASVFDKALAEKRTLLTEAESKQLMEIYGIPVVQTIVCETREAASIAAKQMAFPVVVKLHSELISHKSDVGGVILNLQSVEEVEKAYDQILTSVTHLKGKKYFQGVTVQEMVSPEGYELIIGSTSDPLLGPIVLFGAGGVLVEVFEDRSLGIPPLNSVSAQKMLESTKIYKALKGFRGKAPVNLELLKQVLVAFSTLLIENPKIMEIDINPLRISERGLTALDARVVISNEESPLIIPEEVCTPQPFEHKGLKCTIEPLNMDKGIPLERWLQSLSEEQRGYLDLRSSNIEDLALDLIQVDSRRHKHYAIMDGALKGIILVDDKGSIKMISELDSPVLEQKIIEAVLPSASPTHTCYLLREDPLQAVFEALGFVLDEKFSCPATLKLLKK